MQVAGLWRYPVKSLGGERLASAELTADGVRGDRIVHVRGPRGPLTGRTRHGLLTLPVRTGPDGIPLVNGQSWDSPQVVELVRQRAGDGAALVADESPQRFDVLNLLVATDEAVARFGHDVRRLRPNVLISGVATGDEANWPGHALAIGDVLIGIDSLRARCIVTTIDPDTGEQDLDVLREIRRDFGGELALNCWVIRPGTITVGDQARLVTSDDEPRHYGGWIVGAPYPHLDGPEPAPAAD
ncbi:MAG: MOSC domain-containing protein [Actinobacteria bacterium]|nr:MOSC domain-containing protein [Actinomycetota bacterium]